MNFVLELELAVDTSQKGLITVDETNKILGKADNIYQICSIYKRKATDIWIKNY